MLAARDPALRARHAGCRPRNDLESLGSDGPPTHFAVSVLPLGDANQRRLDCGELVHDLIMHGDVGESLDGDARAFAHPLAERDPPARHVRTGAERGGAVFEIVSHGFEGGDDLVRMRRFGFWLGVGHRRHAVDCTTGAGPRYRRPFAAGHWSLSTPSNNSDTPEMGVTVHSSMIDRSQRPWFQRYPRLALTVSATLFAVIFLIRVSVGGTEDSISMLYVLPVALVALAFGFWAGVAAGLTAVGLLVGWAISLDVESSPLGWIGLVTPVVLLGALVGYASDRIRDASRAERYAAMVTVLQVEGAEISDRIFQGLAASKWMLEVGDIERGLAVLEDTMVIAQGLVTNVLGSNSVLRDDVREHAMVPRAPQSSR